MKVTAGYELNLFEFMYNSNPFQPTQVGFAHSDATTLAADFFLPQILFFLYLREAGGGSGQPTPSHPVPDENAGDTPH